MVFFEKEIVKHFKNTALKELIDVKGILWNVIEDAKHSPTLVRITTEDLELTHN